MNFSVALGRTNAGILIAREGWRNGTFVGKYFPGPSEFITEPFLYIDTTNVISDTPTTVKGKAPWVPSQCDMNARDWYIVGSEPEFSNFVNQNIFHHNVTTFKIEKQENGYTFNTTN